MLLCMSHFDLEFDSDLDFYLKIQTRVPNFILNKKIYIRIYMTIQDLG